MSSRRGTPTQVAASIPLADINGYFTSNITDVEAAIKNIREQRLSKLDIRDTDVESFHVLTNLDMTFHEAIGSGSGYYFQLPNATTLVRGQEFEFSNQSINSIEVRDSTGTNLVTLNSDDIVRLVVTDNSLAAGEWIVQVNSATAAGIQSYSIGSTTPFATTSATDVLITGMITTPASGRYGLWYSSDISISNNNQDAQIVIYQNGVALERTRRTTQGVSSNFNATHQTVAEVTVDGSEQIDIRVNITSGTLTVNSRRLLLIRLGS